MRQEQLPDVAHLFAKAEHSIARAGDASDAAGDRTASPDEVIQRDVDDDWRGAESDGPRQSSQGIRSVAAPRATTQQQHGQSRRREEPEDRELRDQADSEKAADQRAAR